MLRLCFLFTALGATAVAATKETYYFEDQCKQLNTKVVEDTLTLRLFHVANSSTTTFCEAQLGLRAGKESLLLVTISNISLNEHANCSNHFLRVSSSNMRGERLCNEQGDRLTLSVDENSDTNFYYFRNNDLKQSDHVEIIVTPVRRAGEDGLCPPLSDSQNGFFLCEHEKLCIPKALQCDKVQHCVDSSDEHDCIGTTTTDSPRKLSVPSVVLSSETALGAKTSRDSKTPHIIMGIVGGVTIIILVAIIMLVLIKRKARYQKVHLTRETLGSTAKNTGDEEDKIDTTPRL